jgi:hypothetical protein
LEKRFVAFLQTREYRGALEDHLERCLRPGGRETIDERLRDSKGGAAFKSSFDFVSRCAASCRHDD